jgi:hypothetical protein
MADTRVPDVEHEETVDWEDARRRLKAGIALQLGRVRAHDLEDLAAEALVQFLRIVRAQGARSALGLIAVIGRTTAIDEIRRRTRERVRLSRLEIPDAPDASPDDWDDRVRTRWFLMLEFFRTQKIPCHSLALKFAELGDWKQVAQASGLTHSAIRQQWSRCARAFREELRRDGGIYGFEEDVDV